MKSKNSSIGFINLHFNIFFVALLFSGNPFISNLFEKYTNLILFFILFINVGPNKIYNLVKADSQRYLLKILLFLVLIYTLQFLVLDYISFRACLHFILKILIGFILYRAYKSKISMLLFESIFILSLISIIFYLLIFYLNIPINGIKINSDSESYIFYHVNRRVHNFRNCGMFWEPTAFAGYIILSLVLILYDGSIYVVKKYKIVTIILALLTTVSTTGYIAFFVLILFFIKKIKLIEKKLLFLLVVSSIVSYSFISLDFLLEKITDQLVDSKIYKNDETNNTRFGSFLLDQIYIKKHPFIGNGFHEKTRYADHLYLFDNSFRNEIGSGNGISNMMASLGVFFVLLYFIIIYKNFTFLDVYSAILFSSVIFINMLGEQWFDYPYYLGLLFLTKKINNNLASPYVIFKK